MKKKWLFPILSLVAGIVAGILRGVNLTAGYEEETKLVIPGNSTLTAVIVVTIVFVAVMFFLSRKVIRIRNLDFVQAFRCVNTGYKTIAVVCGALLLLCGAAGIYFSFSEQTQQLVLINTYTEMQKIPAFIMWIMYLGAGVSLVGIIGMQSKIEVKSQSSGFLILPMFWGAFQLIVTYLDHAAVPSVSLFAFRIFACICVMYGFYLMAGFLYAKPNTRGFVFWASCAGYFSVMETISAVYDAFIGQNTLDLTMSGIVKLCGLLVGAAFLICNLYILLSNLDYQEKVEDPTEIER